jgi:deoxyribonuclease-4
MRYFGAHVSASGGHQNAIKNGEKYRLNTIQLMPSAPMRWSTKEIDMKEVEALVTEQMNSGVKKILTHGIYLINLARQEKQKFHLSKMGVLTYQNYIGNVIETAENMGSDLEVIGNTFHPGSAQDLSQEEGVKRISEGINWILERCHPKGMLLLESSAGAGKVMGDTLEELTQMRAGTEQKERVGFVLDTQHMFVSGYDWRNDLEGILKKIEETIGLENVHAFHLNDSKTAFESHRDRHENIGEGEIGIEAMKNLINHPKLRDIPMILETPALKSEKTMGEEIEKVKGMLKE